MNVLQQALPPKASAPKQMSATPKLRPGLLTKQMHCLTGVIAEARYRDENHQKAEKTRAYPPNLKDRFS